MALPAPITGPPGPTPSQAIRGVSSGLPRSLYAFPFGDAPGRVPDPEDAAGCGWPAFALLAPADRFLPFCLVRPATLAFLDCVRIVDADRPDLILRTVPFPSSLYEKYTDGSLDYFLYYGAIVPTLGLTTGRRVRLFIDGYLSAAFTACPAPADNAVQLTWSHAGPLGGVPYGTGLQQIYYAPKARIASLDDKEDRRVSKDALGLEVLDFLTLTAQATFTAPHLPAWLAGAVERARSHDTVSVNGLLVRPGSLSVKSEDDDSCRRSITLTWEDPDPLVRRACQPDPGPVMVAAPAGGYTQRGWRCGDASDTAPDWQRLVPAQAECEQDAQPTWQRITPAQTECETI